MEVFRRTQVAFSNNMTEQVNISYDFDDSLSIPQNIVEDYWLNVSGMFTNRINELVEKYGLNSREITSLISSVTAFIDFGNCSASKKIWRL